ncbi:hypothetical protein AAG570_013552 [Ranatra chinensis]|uniref:Major facilitator superfamily (MFS) profile domain-containing protein n=1 Tax=Ranatra chinensis TaxID=642074 RepID=A0ABD0YCI8_9HEMI
MAPDSDLKLTTDQISWFGSLFFVIIPVGCFLSGPFTHKFGRKSLMIWLCVPFFFAWLVFYYATSAALLYVAILLHGFINGLLEAPILTYVAEVTEPKWRGMLSSSSVLASLGGIFLEFLLGSWLPWRHAALVNMIFPVVSFISICFIPESPHWLVGRGRTEDAEKSLRWLRGWCGPAAVSEELEGLVKTTLVKEGANEAETPFTWDPYLHRGFLHPFALVIMSFFIGHFSGMSTLQTYAVSIFESLGSSGYISASAMGLCQLAGGLVCICTLPCLGKRRLALISTIGCGICLLVLASTMDLPQMTPYASVGLLLAAVFLTNSCSKVFPWVLIGEVFSGRLRAVASGLASCVGYALGFLVNKTYFNLLSVLTLRGILFLYGGVSLVGAVLYYFLLPETEGRTLLEVQQHFSGERDLVKGKVNPSFTPDS